MSGDLEKAPEFRGFSRLWHNRHSRLEGAITNHIAVGKNKTRKWRVFNVTGD
jgi:hypothetical protein